MRSATQTIAAVDPLDPAAAAARVGEMLAAVRRRSVKESMLLHPLIGRALPEVRASLDRQHALIEPLVQRVEGLLEAFVASPSRETAGLLHAALQRFVGAVLPHMEEEEALAPLLARLLPVEELAAAARVLAND
jgi:hypothetical protein